ncbi:hypothetical protein AALA00_04360 [Lachnospiraceae bacterium 46-15]
MKREIIEESCGTIGRLGAVKEQGSIVFRVTLDEAEDAYLVLYKKGTDEIAYEFPLKDKRIMGKLYGIRLRNLDVRRHEYNYRIGTKIVQDPYARIVRGRDKFGKAVLNEDGHQIRCGFAFHAYDWKDDAPLGIPYEDAVMYCLHVRGFTMQSSSRVRHRGTFCGVVEKAGYLKELGINQVLLMPAYEFSEIMECHPEKLNFWGYVKGSYFAPKASYAAGRSPVDEMKDMVYGLHRQGIEVLMDFYFTQDIDFRTAADCLIYWAEEYHIDGFHIVGNDGLAKMLAKDPLLAGIKLLGEYFPQEETRQNKKAPFIRNLGEYNAGFMEDMRGLLKGDEGQLEAFTYRLRRNPEAFGVINYIAGHDGFTMMDLVSYSEKHNEENGEQNHDGPDRNISWNCGEEGPTRKKKILELRNRQIRNAFLMLLLAGGTPLIQAGDEFGNSQKGNNNPYCLDNEISWTDWRAAKKNEALTDFVRDVIAFRKRHRILHMPRELKLIDTLFCGYPEISYHSSRAWYVEFESYNREIGILYCGEYAGEEEFIYVAYNLHWKENDFALPNLPDGMGWYVAIDSACGVYPEGEEPIYAGDRILAVPARTVKVLIGRGQKDVKRDNRTFCNDNKTQNAGDEGVLSHRALPSGASS